MTSAAVEHSSEAGVPDSEFQIIEMRVHREEAGRRVLRRLGFADRVFAGIGGNAELREVSLYYKPYYFTLCLQSKRFGIKRFEEAEIYVSVDGLSGVASVYREQPDWVGATRAELPADATALAPTVTPADAVQKTDRRRAHLQVRHKCSVSTLWEEPLLVHKPIWLVTVAGKRRDKRYAVDAYTGYVLQE